MATTRSFNAMLNEWLNYDLLREELEFMGPVKLKEVEAAQGRIVDQIKRLEEQEEITISFRGGGSEEVRRQVGGNQSESG